MMPNGSSLWWFKMLLSQSSGIKFKKQIGGDLAVLILIPAF